MNLSPYCISFVFWIDLGKEDCVAEFGQRRYLMVNSFFCAALDYLKIAVLKIIDMRNLGVYY